MSVLDILKPSPHIDEIKDAQFVKKEYKYWRLRTFYGMYAGYATFYLTRKSFNAAMPDMVGKGYDKVQLGTLISVTAIAYGVSKFLSGIISDKSNPRYFMGLGLILTGILNIFFGLSSSILLFSIFWGLNGWFQGWGWPPSAKLLTHWYSHSERGRWWSFWNTSHNLGGALIPFLAAIILENFDNWRYVMYVPGVISIGIGLFVINRLRDTPQSLGLPPIEKFKNDYPPEKKDFLEKTNLSAREILVEYVLKNKYIWVLAIASTFIYIVRTSMDAWGAVFFAEKRGYSPAVANKILCFFEGGGFLGSLAAGWLSDCLFKGKRGPINALFTLFIAVPAFFLWQSHDNHIVIDCILSAALGFFIFGPQMMLGIAAAELSHKKAAGTATGFIGNFAYLGTCLAGVPFGWAIQQFGWESYFLVIFISLIIALACLFPLWSVTDSSERS